LIGQQEGFSMKNYIGPLLGMVLVSLSGTTATAQQKNSEPATVISGMGRSFSVGGYASTIEPAFDVVSIKPNKSGDALVGIQSTTDGFTATNYTLQKLIRVAYGVQDDQISGGPNWLNSLRYDVDAKMDGSVAEELQKLSSNQHKVVVGGMLQALLADRFGLRLHKENEEIPVYALVIAENGLKLQRAIPGDTYPNGFKSDGGVPLGVGCWSQPGKLVGQGVPITPPVQDLSERYLHRTVLDKTGLIDNYDFTLQWTPDEGHGAIFKALEEQLGLKLESQKGSREILVIDHAEKPSEN
jgi:uncharacterized protein (TIGR03435 family)